MSIAKTGAYEEEIGGESRRLLIRNDEIERFEAQHIGVYQFFDQLFGREPGLRAGHVRDLIALGLVGGGMTDKAADAFVASLPPSENLNLRLTAQRLLGVTFIPAVLEEQPKKPGAGSRKGKAKRPESDTTPEK